MAAAVVLGVVLLKTALGPAFGSRVPFLMLFGAVLLGAWFGGPGPGLLGALLATVAADYFLTPPTWGLLRVGSAEWLQLGFFLGEGVLVSSLVAVRNRGESELREQREWFRVTLASIGDAVIVTDAAGRVAFLNAAAQAVTGWSYQEARGRDVLEVLRICALRTGQPVEDLMGKVLQREPLLAAEEDYVLRTRDGREVPIEDSSSAMQDEAGRLLGAVVVFRDVAGRRGAERERRAAEEALRRSRDQLEIVLHSIADGITVQAPDGRLVYANEAAARVIGAPSVEALLRMSVPQILQNFRLYDEAGAPLPLEQLPGRRALAGEETAETLLRFEVAATGEQHWSIVKARPVRGPDGQVQLVVNVFHDVTERKRAADARHFLGEASDLLAGSLDYQATLEKVAHLAVPRIADWCGVDILSEDDSLERLAVAHVDPAKVALAHELWKRYPVDLGRTQQPGLARVLHTGEAEFYPEITDEMLASSAQDAEHLQILRKLGLRSALAVPLLARGRTLGAVTLVLAESGRRYTQADLELARDLARRAALALDNARLYGQSVAAARQKDEFLAMLAHELRNPMAPILSACQVMTLQGAEDPTQRWAIGVLERQTRQLAHLVDDLLDVSRITRGKVDLRRELVDVRELIDRALDTSRPLLEARRHELLVEKPETPLLVEGDPLRLEQVLVNLLDNAAKYTEPGGRIWLSAGRQKEDIVLKVRDTGAGIAREMLPRIFDLFIQGSRALDRAQGGLGIGLTLVRSLVALHGGSVKVRSEGQGKGSEFAVHLPAAQPPQPVVAAESAGTAPSGEADAEQDGSLRVLVVDDNVDSATGMGEVLKLWGFDVRLAYDGPAAVELAREFRPDTVLLDIGLPGMDGYEVARALRSQPALAGALLVALTGYGQQDDQRRSREAGFDLHYTKPVDLQALRKLLASRSGEA